MIKREDACPLFTIILAPSYTTATLCSQSHEHQHSCQQIISLPGASLQHAITFHDRLSSLQGFKGFVVCYESVGLPYSPAFGTRSYPVRPLRKLTARIPVYPLTFSTTASFATGESATSYTFESLFQRSYISSQQLSRTFVNRVDLPAYEHNTVVPRYHLSASRRVSVLNTNV